MRKPPKVSRGYGGGARAALPSGLRVGEGLSTRITTFGLASPPQIGSGLGEAKFANPRLPGGQFGTDFQNLHIPIVPVAYVSRNLIKMHINKHFASCDLRVNLLKNVVFLKTSVFCCSNL